MEKKKILVVDNEVDFLDMAKFMLEQTGNYEVCTEQDSTKALAVAKKFKPDLILLDIMMPKIDGPELSTKLKANHETKGIPVLFVTAAVTKKEADKNYNIIGGNAIISKSTSMEEFISLVEDNIG